MKTGECYFRDENEMLWMAESFQNEQGLTWTIHTLVSEE